MLKEKRKKIAKPKQLQGWICCRHCIHVLSLLRQHRHLGSSAKPLCPLRLLRHLIYTAGPKLFCLTLQALARYFPIEGSSRHTGL